MQNAGERAGIEVDVEDQRTGGLGLGHSDRGRAERASGKARAGHAERLVAGARELDVGALAVVAAGGCRRAPEARVDQEPAAGVEPGLKEISSPAETDLP